MTQLAAARVSGIQRKGKASATPITLDLRPRASNDWSAALTMNQAPYVSQSYGSGVPDAYNASNEYGIDGGDMSRV